MPLNHSNFFAHAGVSLRVTDRLAINRFGLHGRVEYPIRAASPAERIEGHMRGDRRGECRQPAASRETATREREDDLFECRLNEVFMVLLPPAEDPIEGRVNHGDQSVVKFAGRPNVAIDDGGDERLIA
jgi:hypothetical protein